MRLGQPLINHATYLTVYALQLQPFIHLPEAQSFFIRSAESKDVEVAKSAAFVPPAEAQRAPGVVGHTVVLFELLLSHPDPGVSLEAMEKWADAESPIDLGRGLPVLTKMLAFGQGVAKRWVRGFAGKV